MSESTVTWRDGRLSTSQPLLRLAANDNVAVALRTLREHEALDCDQLELTTTARVMKGHKVALAPIARGEKVVKYSQVIGLASQQIDPGDHVHTHNLSFSSDYERQLVPIDVQRVSVQGTDTFMGYARPGRRAGTRNFIAVLSTVNCSATIAHHIADSFSHEQMAAFANVDGVAAFTHGTGCGMDMASDGFAHLQRVIAGYATHPNIGGVLIVGLGCETSQITGLIESQRLAEHKLLRTMTIQSTGGHRKTLQRGKELVAEMLEEINQQQRSPCAVSELSLALQCGGSDAWSGITANPALGHAADLLVQQGGTAVLAETPEIYGAEHLLIARASSPLVAEKLENRIAWWQDYVARHNGSLDNNPSPGNKLGGLTTILEKSLGAVAKAGTSALMDVVEYAESVNTQGFVFMDTPGYDPVSVTGQIAGGCNLVAFTTGRGSTFGSKPTPSLKIATNSDMYSQMQEDMDINAGTIVSEGESVQTVGTRIYQQLLDVASGARTCSELNGLGNNEFVPWQIGATM